MERKITVRNIIDIIGEERSSRSTLNCFKITWSSWTESLIKNGWEPNGEDISLQLKEFFEDKFDKKLSHIFSFSIDSDKNLVLSIDIFRL